MRATQRRYSGTRSVTGPFSIIDFRIDRHDHSRQSNRFVRSRAMTQTAILRKYHIRRGTPACGDHLGIATDTGSARRHKYETHSSAADRGFTAPQGGRPKRQSQNHAKPANPTLRALIPGHSGRHPALVAGWPPTIFYSSPPGCQSDLIDRTCRPMFENATQASPG